MAVPKSARAVQCVIRWRAVLAYGAIREVNFLKIAASEHATFLAAFSRLNDDAPEKDFPDVCDGRGTAQYFTEIAGSFALKQQAPGDA
jgi:hypothetical protein